MPSVRAHVPAYQLHKATGQARVTLGGRDVYLGAYGSPESRERYDRLIAEWLAAGRRLELVPSRRPAQGRTTINALIAGYWEHCKGYYQKEEEATKTLPNIRTALRRLRQLYGRMAVEEFGPGALKALRQSWIEEGLSVRTINYKTGWIKHCFRWGVAEELVPPGVLHALQAVPGLKPGRCAAKPPRKVEPVSDELVEATLPHLNGVVADMVRVQRLLGCRSGEVCSMTGADIDTSGEIWIYRPRRHKTQHHGKLKLYQIGPRAQAILRRYLRPQLERPLFSPRDAEQERREQLREVRKTPLTPSQRRREAERAKRQDQRQRPPAAQYTSNSYRRAVARACERAEVPHWHPHQLRHARATEIRKRFGLDGAAAVLGNTVEAAEIYAARDVELAARIARATG